MEPLAGIEWVLWAGTLGLESPIRSRVDAARAAGYTRISVSPLDIRRAAEQGSTPRQLGVTLREAGLGVVVDPVMTWCGPPMPGIALAAVSVDEVVSMAEALEAVSLGAIAHPAVDRPIAELAEPFAALCDRAADIGARVHLEFMPMLAIGDLSAAWAIVSDAGRENGGLLVDTWHFFRGNPDFELLERVPGDRIFGVQVADAAAADSGDLGRDTFNRVIPGEGSLDLLRVLGSLDRIGGLGCVGPEVISPVTASMDPVDAARLSRHRISGLIGQVRSAREG